MKYFFTTKVKVVLVVALLLSAGLAIVSNATSLSIPNMLVQGFLAPFKAGAKALTCTEVTDIHYRVLSEKEIEGYVASGEPMDKAGSYGIQGGAALFAEKMVGDYYNVMGLPVCKLWQLLQKIAPELLNA